MYFCISFTSIRITFPIQYSRALLNRGLSRQSIRQKEEIIIAYTVQLHNHVSYDNVFLTSSMKPWWYMVEEVKLNVFLLSILYLGEQSILRSDR
jgi:hypothetical protein